MAPKQFKLNVGGTKYEVSDTLLDGFPESMLRKITSDTWNQNHNEKNDADDEDKQKSDDDEIFIERDGGRFKYVLDFMRDGTVTLPPSIPRQQLLKDMEYYGIDFDGTKITLSVTDENDLFTHFSDYYKEWRTFQSIFDSKQKEIDRRYREIGAESVANEIALKFFQLHFSETTKSFKARTISVRLVDANQQQQGYNYSIDELQPHLDQYGLKSCDLIFMTNGVRYNESETRNFGNYGDAKQYYENYLKNEAKQWYNETGIYLQLTIDIPH